MRIAAVLLILFCLASGCSDKDGIPSDIIPREEMGKILWDMVEADQYSAIYLAKDSVLLAAATPPVSTGAPAAGVPVALRAGKYPVQTPGKIQTGTGKKDSAHLVLKNLHISAKDSIRIRHRRDSVRAVGLKDSLLLSKRKDSFRLSLKMKDLGLYQQVFQLHHVSRDDFRKSFQFYLDHPDITKTLIDSVLARGNRLRMESYTTPPAHADSTKKSPVPLPGASGVPSVVPGVPAIHPNLPPNFPHKPVVNPGAKGKPADPKGKPGGVKP
jgi:hypothetical protein